MSKDLGALLERLNSGEDLDEDELLYLHDRGKLPKDVAWTPDSLSEGVDLELQANTGTANTAGLSIEQLEELLEKMRAEQGVGEEEEEETDDREDYDQGWTNEMRIEELEKRELSSDGNKRALIRRLIEDDESKE